MRYYISIEKNIEVFELYKDLWSLKGIVGIRAGSMTEGIEKAIEIENSKTDELYFIDIVANDIDFMPQLSILSARTSAPILIATSDYDENEHHKAQDNGADFYGKYCETSDKNIKGVVSFINTLNRRAIKPIQPIELIFYGKILISPTHRHVFVDDKETGLTKTEFDVLYYLANNIGHAKTFEQIYDHVWGEESDKSVTEAVKAVIKKIRFKTNVDIENVWGVGYRLPTLSEQT
jgi:two-component system alkaline phosphatase synthesis response regulator PhoP